MVLTRISLWWICSLIALPVLSGDLINSSVPRTLLEPCIRRRIQHHQGHIYELRKHKVESKLNILIINTVNRFIINLAVDFDQLNRRILPLSKDNATYFQLLGHEPLQSGSRW